jgi:predicted Zn-dependent peptidase
VYSTYGIGAAAEQCNKYLSHIVFKDDITQKYFDGEQKIVCQEVKGYDFDEKVDAERLAWENFFKGTTYSHDTAGTTRDVMGFTLQDVKNYKKDNYTLDKTVLGIAGNITAQEAERLIQEYWLSNLAKLVIKSKASEEMNFQPILRSAAKNNRSMTQHNAAIIMPLEGEGMGLNILRKIISNRLFDKVREDKKLVYGIAASTEHTQKYGNVFGINFKTTTDNTKQVFEIVAQELNKIKSGKISERELDIAKNGAMFGQSTIHGSVEDNCDIMVNELYKYGKVSTIDEKIKKIGKITLGEIKDCARKGLKTDAATIAVIGPDAEKLKPIEYLGF